MELRSVKTEAMSVFFLTIVSLTPKTPKTVHQASAQKIFVERLTQ